MNLGELIESTNNACRHSPQLRNIGRVWGAIVAGVMGPLVLSDLMSGDPNYLMDALGTALFIEGTTDLILGRHHYASMHALYYIQKGIWYLRGQPTE